MRQVALAWIVAFALVLLTVRGAHAAGPWDGEWVTDLGLMTLSEASGKISGSYAEGGRVEGSAEGRTLTLTWTRGGASGEASFERSEDGRSFKGSWKGPGGGGGWRGWRADPEATKASDADFSGAWLSSLGTLQLEQKGKQVKGIYGAQGWGSLEGEVNGRRLNLRWKRLQGSGAAWLEQTPDGQRVFGLTEEQPPATWIGVRLTGFERHVRPKPGQVVEGRAANGMLYFLHTPKGWKKGKATDVIVLLHGSNWTTKGMVHVTARNAALGEKYMIVGIQGEQWATWSEPDDLRFNYTYVNWMGRSTYKGYPNTDRESPTLVTQVVDELKAEYGLGRVFIGGHSQGGFLTYLLHQHFPEKWAGTFPMSGGLVMQAEPDVFEDKALLAAQRACPMAIVHGSADDVVPFSTGQYCHERFLSHGFPLLTLLAPATGHPFDFLPLGDAIAWLDALSTKDVAALAAFAKERADAGAWRDVAAALVRAKALKGEAKVADVAKRLAEAAGKDAAAHLAAIRTNADGSWVEAYLAWHDAFEFAPSVRSTVEAFEKLRAEHDAPAEKLMTQAQAAFRSGDASAGWAAYQTLVDQHYAARQARVVRRWLSERK